MRVPFGALRWRAFDYPRHPPDTAIDLSMDEVSIAVARATRATSALDSPAVQAFFDALVELLTGAGRKR